MVTLGLVSLMIVNIGGTGPGSALCGSTFGALSTPLSYWQVQNDHLMLPVLASMEWTKE